jgi:hypothetical protein
MFLEYFIRAREYLSQHGLKPGMVMGAPVSEHELNALDKETDLPTPPELRHFYVEMGDGFRFDPAESDLSGLVGWDPMRLADHRICNIGFGGEIEREAMSEIGKPTPRTDPALLKEEMQRRKLWMPFYGLVGGGDYLCLDLSVSPPSVRFYESLVWVAVPWTWDFILAPSFTEFVERWSRYHFLTPAGEWTSFCTERSGRFDWAPEYFPTIRAQS